MFSLVEHLNPSLFLAEEVYWCGGEALGPLLRSICTPLAGWAVLGKAVRGKALQPSESPPLPRVMGTLHSRCRDLLSIKADRGAALLWVWKAVST